MTFTTIQLILFALIAVMNGTIMKFKNQMTNQLIVKDSNGNLLADGDDVLLIKDLKLKGSSEVLKKGTKFKNIRLVNGDHNVDCGKIMLKSEFLKKLNRKKYGLNCPKKS